MLSKLVSPAVCIAIFTVFGPATASAASASGMANVPGNLGATKHEGLLNFWVMLVDDGAGGQRYLTEAECVATGSRMPLVSAVSNAASQWLAHCVAMAMDAKSANNEAMLPELRVVAAELRKEHCLNGACAPP